MPRPLTFHPMSAPGTPTISESPCVSRARMIAERQQRYPVWRIIHLLSSLKLALLLLATIAIACAVATVAESHFDASVARAWIYKAPWFIAWLGVLCMNLFAVTLSRWPWQKPHTGFIITHYGIILLLIGAVVGSKLGFEGNVTLRTDGQPQRRIITDRSTLQIESPADSYLYLLPFDAKQARPTEKKPRILSIPGTSLKMVIDGSSEHLVRTPRLESATGTAAGAAALLDFTSQNLNQSLRIGLGTGEGSPAEYDFFGLAKISFHRTLPEHGAKGVRDSLDIIAGNPPRKGVSLSKDGTLVTLHPEEALSITYRRDEVMHREIASGGMKVLVQEYHPPEVTGKNPRLPEIRIELLSETTVATDGKPWLEMAPASGMKGADGQRVAYQLGRSDQIMASGVLNTGDLLPLDWADWRMRLRQTGTNASVGSAVEPGEPQEQGGIPGFHAYLRDTQAKNETLRGAAQWIISGEVTPLTLGENLVRVGYGLELRPIPFSIALTDFQVPRDEGSETPSDFQATVLFKNAKTGEEKSGLIHMNHPASYPGGLFANMTGLNYKFSQAEWNPRDLRETTLQVLYDPGWFFKWTGSLAICLGIATMFYIRPRS